MAQTAVNVEIAVKLPSERLECSIERSEHQQFAIIGPTSVPRMHHGLYDTGLFSTEIDDLSLTPSEPAVE